MLTEEDEGTKVRIGQAMSSVEPRCQGLKVRCDEYAFMIVIRARRSATSYSGISSRDEYEALTRRSLVK